MLFTVMQKITLDDLSESKSALDDKSADPSHSMNSMQTATHENSSVAVYEVCAALSPSTGLPVETQLD